MQPDLICSSQSAPFYRVPKSLLNGGLSLEAVALYALLLDRDSLSRLNGWTDEQGRVFVYFTQRETQSRLRCGHNRATALMRELERAGLIQRKRQGLGKPNRIFVKTLLPSTQNTPEENTAEKTPVTRSQNTAEKTPVPRSQNAAEKTPASRSQNAAGETSAPAIRNGVNAAPRRETRGFFSGPAEAFQNASGRRSGTPGMGFPDCLREAPNQTERNQTELNHIHRVLPQPPRTSGGAGMDEIRWMKTELRENIDYEGLLRDCPWDRDLFDGYVDLMTEAACRPGGTVRVCGQEMPAAAVRDRFLRLEREHILYVRDRLCHAAGKIANIKAYTLAALYNAPATMSQYYASLVARDMGTM